MMQLCPTGKKSPASCEALYEFRPITRYNVDCVRALHNKLFPIQKADEFYESMLNGDLGSLLLYKADNNQIIGISTWCLPSDSKHIGYICSFGVRKSFRRRGLGKDLMNATLEKMREQNCREIQLHVETTNVSAVNLYLKCGFMKRTEDEDLSFLVKVVKNTY